MARLQKMTSDVTQSKFVVLNASALPTSTSNAHMSASARPGSRLGSSRAPTPVSPTGSTAALESEVVLLQDALDTCDKERLRLEHENNELREVLSDIHEWTTGVKDDLKEINVEEEEGETGDDANEADEVGLYMITPHEFHMLTRLRPCRTTVRFDTKTIPFVARR